MMPVKGSVMASQSDKGLAWTRTNYDKNKQFTALSLHAAVKSTVRAALVAQHPDIFKVADVAATASGVNPGNETDTANR